MASRLDLQTKLETILGSRNVYFQPPESIKIRYPAIVYYLANIAIDAADDTSYNQYNQYVMQYISDDPDNTVVSQLLQLPYCRFERRFVADNLYHDNLRIYF